MTNTENHQKYLALVHGICGPNSAAFRWFCQAMEFALLWDHVADSDPIDKAQAESAFLSVSLDWVNNEWYYANRTVLSTVLASGFSAWKHGTVTGNLEEQFLIYRELPCALVMLLRGASELEGWMAPIRDLIDREIFEDVRRDHDPFIIMSLPRSRSAWLAAFLTNGNVHCHHELLRNCDHPAEYWSKLLATKQPIVGDSDPAMVIFYEALSDKFGKHRVVFVERDEAQAKESHDRMVKAAGITAPLDWAPISGAWKKVRELCPDAPVFRFDQLGDKTVLDELCMACTGKSCDPERLFLMDELKVEAIPSKVISNQRILP